CVRDERNSNWFAYW
nr:immunoglobulin heavy chain junction region [Mus musculus]